MVFIKRSPVSRKGVFVHLPQDAHAVGGPHRRALRPLGVVPRGLQVCREGGIAPPAAESHRPAGDHAVKAPPRHLGEGQVQLVVGDRQAVGGGFVPRICMQRCV